MSEFYDGIREIASELLTEFKQGTIAYVKSTLGTGGTPDNPALPTLTSYPINAVARGVQYKYVMRGLALASDLQVTFAYVYGETLAEGDQDLWDALGEAIQDSLAEQITVGGETAGEAVIPVAMEGFIDVNSVRYKIMQVIPKPAAEPVAYTLIIRR